MALCGDNPGSGDRFLAHHDSADPDGAFPGVFVVPVDPGGSRIVISSPGRRVAGMSLIARSDPVWSMAPAPFVVVSTTTSFGEQDVYVGASDVGRLLRLFSAALVISMVYHGLMQSLTASLVGHLDVSWVSMMFATTFAASWQDLTLLLALGVVLGTPGSRCARGVARYRGLGTIFQMPGWVRAAVVSTPTADTLPVFASRVVATPSSCGLGDFVRFANDPPAASIRPSPPRVPIRGCAKDLCETLPMARSVKAERLRGRNSSHGS